MSAETRRQTSKAQTHLRIATIAELGINRAAAAGGYYRPHVSRLEYGSAECLQAHLNCKLSSFSHHTVHRN
eukprot:scaffold561389_cov18-Prasinocladus_malaysianus.AAC.1